MIPDGVLTLRFDYQWTDCDFDAISDLKIPTSVQTVFCCRDYDSYGARGEDAKDCDWLLRQLPASVSTCVLSGVLGRLRAGVLPKDLRSLTLEGDFAIEDGVLPLALETLTLAGEWTLRPKNILSRYQSIIQLALNHTAWDGYVAMDHSMYPPNLQTLILGPKSSKGNAPLKLPGSVKKLVFYMTHRNQLAVGALPEGLTHLEFVDVDFDFPSMSMFQVSFPQTLKYIKISMDPVDSECATRGVDFINTQRPDILVEVGLTEYENVFLGGHENCGLYPM
jgi:hypothetical protein